MPWVSGMSCTMATITFSQTVVTLKQKSNKEYSFQMDKIKYNYISSTGSENKTLLRK